MRDRQRYVDAAVLRQEANNRHQHHPCAEQSQEDESDGWGDKKKVQSIQNAKMHDGTPSRRFTASVPIPKTLQRQCA